MVSKKELKDALINLGLEKGMALEVHSSLSSFGELEGGAMTVIDTLKELVTDQGSIFMPALRLSPELPLSDEDKKLGITVKIKVLPREEKRTAMGLIADTFRNLPGTLCGTDVISTAGWGKHADEAVKGAWIGPFTMAGRLCFWAWIFTNLRQCTTWKKSHLRKSAKFLHRTQKSIKSIRLRNGLLNVVIRL